MVQLNRTIPGGFNKLPKWFVKHYASELTRGQLLVYLVLLSKSRDGITRGTYEEIADWADMSTFQVKRDVRRLLELGLIWRRNRPQKGVASEYVLAWKQPSGVPRTVPLNEEIEPFRGTTGGTPYKKHGVAFKDDGRDDPTSESPEELVSRHGLAPSALRAAVALDEWVAS